MENQGRTQNLEIYGRYKDNNVKHKVEGESIVNINHDARAKMVKCS